MATAMLAALLLCADLSTAATTAAAMADVPLAAALQSLRFLNEGTVKASDSFARLTQCNGFAECYTTWNCGSVRDYLYDITSGAATPAVPPVGMRSAVPLGGLGTGTFELRADGSFADWQVENQGPALATDATQNSKLPLLEGAMLGLKVGGLATTLRTHPPDGLPAAEALIYSGAYPFARLGLSDSRLPAGLSAQVYAYSAVKLHDENASALPAVAFTLVLENKGTEPINASFLLALPLASTASTSRRHDCCHPYGNSTIKTIPGLSAAGCLAACGSTPDCTYWDLNTEPTPAVPLVPAVPAAVHPDHDCPDPNLPGPSDTPFETIEQCYAHCNATKGCNGFVWDTIRAEIPGQCKGKPGEFCCIMKGTCRTFVPKKGDIAVTYGSPEIPGKPAVPGPGCVLHSGAPAVQQYRTKQVCTSETYDHKTALPCADLESGPDPSWSAGASAASGVKGEWAAAGKKLVHTRANPVVNAMDKMDPSSAVGDYTLLSSSADALVSIASADTTSKLWSDFAADGVLDGAVATHAGSGAVAAGLAVAPGATQAITLVFAWRMPLRNYVGEPLGNFYSEIVESSTAAADSMAERLEEVAVEGGAFNQLFTNSTYPRWFQDFLINSLATQPKMGIWVTKQCPLCPQHAYLENGRLPGTTANGRYRTYEAFSGCDLDPVHVSDYHQIPYGTFYPDLTKNVIFTGWAEMQKSDGMVQEVLGSMGGAGRITGTMDESAGGRIMSDTTCIFILDTYQVWLNTADLPFVKATWPHLVHAAQWQINRTLEGNGFPHHLQNTYDYLGLDKYPNAAYSGFTHLAAMKAMENLAAVVSDTTGVAAGCTASATLCAKTMNETLWTGTHWRAAAPWPHGDAIMSGTLHGQSWANLLGLGLLAPKEQLLSHIKMEVQINCAYDKTGKCFLGQQTLPQAPTEAGWALDGSPSMNFDNAANAMWVGGASFDDPLTAGAKASVLLYHELKNDIWDWKDLHMGPDGKTCGATSMPQGAALAGEPFVNAHYARQLQGWMVQRAASGQFYSAPEKRLELRPSVSHAGPGARLPWFAGKAAGMLVVGGGESDEPHKLEVRLGAVDAGLTVLVEAAGRRSEVRLGAVGAGETVALP
jgi:non-lysosomal glucosylceramidase